MLVKTAWCIRVMCRTKLSACGLSETGDGKSGSGMGWFPEFVSKGEVPVDSDGAKLIANSTRGRCEDQSDCRVLVKLRRIWMIVRFARSVEPSVCG